MLAVSTCWKSWDAESGDDILIPILDAGVNVIELEYQYDIFATTLIRKAGVKEVK